MADEALPTEWEYTAKLAREGDIGAARDILRRFVETTALAHRTDWPSQLPWECTEYIAEAFRKILDEGLDPANALGLKQARAGRRAGAGSIHDLVALAAAYWLAVRRGRTRENAKERLRSAVGADRRTVERAANDCSAFEDPQLYDESLLLAMLQPPGHIDEYPYRQLRETLADP